MYPPTELGTPTIEYLKSSLQSLRMYRADRPNGYNDIADDALRITRKSFERFRPFFVASHAIVTYHGSIQYHDAINLDVDIIIISDKKTPRVIFESAYKLQNEMNNLESWPTGKCETNFAFLTLDQIEKETKLFNRGVQYDRNIHLDSMLGSCILTSELIFPKQQKDFDKIKNKFTDILKASPVLLGATIEEVEDCIKTRKERRMR